MEHRIFRVVSFELVAPMTLRVRFDDDFERTIDFKPVLAGEIFGPLRDPTLFSQVKIDPEVHTLVWPNGADFDPETLHDWPLYVDTLAAISEGVGVGGGVSISLLPDLCKGSEWRHNLKLHTKLRLQGA